MKLRRRVEQSIAFLLVVSASLGALIGCSRATDGGGFDNSLKNQAEWTMPLHEFIAYPSSLGNYAEQLLISKCLVAQGYEWSVPWRDVEFPEPEDFNRFGYRLFDQSIAERWGYHFAPPANGAELRAWVEFGEFANSYAPDAAFDGAFEKCSDAARYDETMRDMDGFNYISGLAVQAGDVALQEPKVQAGLAAWRECLTPQVEFAVPQYPWTDMPPQSVSERFGLSGTGKTLTATAEEIAVAIADAKCQESSGLSEALYDAEWDQQAKVVAENRDKLDTIRANALAHKEFLLTIIAENAPPAP